jgi:hypothetical protein
MSARFGIDASILVRLATDNPENGHMKTSREHRKPD